MGHESSQKLCINNCFFTSSKMHHVLVPSPVFRMWDICILRFKVYLYIKKIYIIVEASTDLLVMKIIVKNVIDSIFFFYQEIFWLLS
jgi:hypothetical protein